MKRRILFAGYAPVHFLCFLPVYRLLREDDRLDIWLSGGFRRKEASGVSYSLDGFYDGQPVEPDRIVPFEAAREEPFDVVICAHTSDTLFPRRAVRKVQIFHGVSFKNFAIREKVLRYDFVCLPGAYHARRYRERGLVRNGSSACLLTGFPKSDAIVTTPPDRRATLEAAGLDPSRPTILFAPTGGKHNALETCGRELIGRIRKRGGWNLLVKPHDHPKRAIDWFSELADLEGEGIRLVRDYDIVPYLTAADLLLTDASSVAVEYTLLDRPIVFVDVPKLFRNVLKRGAPLDLDTHGRKIGAVAGSVEETVAAIGAALATPGAHSDLRRATARDVFHDPGHAAARVASVVSHAAGLTPDLPGGIERLAP